MTTKDDGEFCFEIPGRPFSMSLHQIFLLLSLALLVTINAEPTLVTIRGRLTRTKTTSKVYATMLVQYTADITDLPGTTTLDAELQAAAEDSNGEESPMTATGITEESFTERRNNRSKTGSLTSSTSTVLDQSLIDEYIFTTKQVKAQQCSLASTIQVCGSLMALALAMMLLI